MNSFFCRMWEGRRGWWGIGSVGTVTNSNSVLDFEFFKLLLNGWAYMSLVVNRGVTGQYLYTKLRYYNNVNKVQWIIDTVIILQLPYS